MPRRSTGGGTAGRVALLHAIAHIEFNAIDLAFDLVARFATPALPRAFTIDWIRIGAEEAKHFQLICARMRDLGAEYGDLPAHDGLWQSAQATAHSLTARLAVVPLVLEARGLDVTPGMIKKLRRSGDDPSADVLEVIYRDEISHVAAGRRWFDFACALEGKEPVATWQSLVAAHHTAGVKAPVNTDGREAAGFPRHYYEPLVR